MVSVLPRPLVSSSLPDYVRDKLEKGEPPFMGEVWGGWHCGAGAVSRCI